MQKAPRTFFKTSTNSHHKPQNHIFKENISLDLLSITNRFLDINCLSGFNLVYQYMRNKIFTALIIPSLLLSIFIMFPRPSDAVNSPELISTTSNEQNEPAIVADSNGKIHVV